MVCEIIKTQSIWNRPSVSHGVLILSLILLSHWAFGGWTHESSWKQLQKNMNSDDVEKLMGIPKDKEETSLRSVWYYQESPIRENGKVLSRPKQGYVNFSKSSSDPVTRQRFNKPELFVSTWAAPNWGAITEEEKKADIPEVDLTMPQLPAEFEQHHQEIIKQQEEQSRKMEEHRKQLEEEFERQHKETMERIQTLKQAAHQRVDDVNIPAINIPRRTFTSPTQPASPGVPVMQPAQQQNQKNLQTARQAGAIVGFIFIILIVVVLVLLLLFLAKKRLS